MHIYDWNGMVYKTLLLQSPLNESSMDRFVKHGISSKVHDGLKMAGNGRNIFKHQEGTVKTKVHEN